MGSNKKEYFDVARNTDGSVAIKMYNINTNTGNSFQKSSKPLGLTVFQAQEVKRNGLHLGMLATDLGHLAARCSRLWMNDKPMLVTELFLPLSPIYRINSVE